MTDAQRRYVRTEMIVATIINAILSIVFMLIVFGGQPIVAVGGRGGLIVDSIPQTAMIALMSMLVPSLLTRRRLKTEACWLRRWQPRSRGFSTRY
jgi:hypothetical protein